MKNDDEVGNWSLSNFFLAVKHPSSHTSLQIVFDLKRGPSSWFSQTNFESFIQVIARHNLVLGHFASICDIYHNTYILYFSNLFCKVGLREEKNAFEPC